jgi:hypothetical protein
MLCELSHREERTKMGFVRRKVPTHYIPIHPHNVSNKDWIILLEAGTIIGPSARETPGRSSQLFG